MGFTQRDLAKKAGITPAALSGYEADEENKRKTPPLDKARAITEALGCSLDWLCGLTESQEVKTEETTIPLSEILQSLIQIRTLSDPIEFEQMPTFDKIMGDYFTIATLRLGNYDVVSFLQSYEKVFSLYAEGTLTKEMYLEWLNGSLQKYKDKVIDLNEIGTLGSPKEEPLPFT